MRGLSGAFEAILRCFDRAIITDADLRWETLQQLGYEPVPVAKETVAYPTDDPEWAPRLWEAGGRKGVGHAGGADRGVGAVVSRVAAGRAPGAGATLPVQTPALRPLPPLPKPLNVSALEKYIRGLGFEVANNRWIEGGLLVFHDATAFGAVAKHPEQAGIGVNYMPQGRKHRARPQYDLDPLKRLPP